MTTVSIDSMLEMQSKADFNEAKTAFEVFTDCKDIVERCNREFQTAIVAIQPVILEKWLDSVTKYQTDSGDHAERLSEQKLFIEYLAKETLVFKPERNLLVFYIEKIKIRLYLWYNNCSEI